MGCQHHIHLIFPKASPQVQQVLIGQLVTLCQLHLFRRIAVAVAVDQHIHRILQLRPADAGANLLECHRKQVQSLKLDCFIGSHHHSAALFQSDQAFLESDRGFRDKSALLHHRWLLALPIRVGGNSAVVHPFDLGLRRTDFLQDVIAVHTLLDRSCYILRKEGCAVRGRKKFLQTVAVLTGHLDVKSLELSLERIVTGKLGAPVLLGRIQTLQTFGKTLSALVKILGNRDILIVILHLKNSFCKL